MNYLGKLGPKLASLFPSRNRLDMLIWAIIGAQLILALVAFPFLPSVVHAHFGLRSQANSYPPRWFANLLIPSICAIVWLSRVRQIAGPGVGPREQQGAGTQRRNVLFLGMALVLLVLQTAGTALDLDFVVRDLAPIRTADAAQSLGATGASGALATGSARAPESLIDRARTAPGWRNLGTLDSNAFREASIVYDGGTYYVFNTYAYETNGVAVRAASSPEEIASATPATDLAPLVYPSVVKDAATGIWHMWGRNVIKDLTQHYTSHSPTGPWVFSDNITINLNDFSVAKHPTNGYWYGIGFLTGMAPLTLLRASNPAGPWTSMGDLFADTGAPPFSDKSRPDPNLALGVDGRDYIFFTGHPSTILTNAYFPAIAEVNLATGRVKNSPVVLFNEQLDWTGPTNPASDLQFLRVPGQPDRIFGFTNDGGTGGSWAWGCLDLANLPVADDGRQQDDLVRLDMQQGLDIATGIRPPLLTGADWQDEGLEITAPGGGAYGYPAVASLADLGMYVEFTPTTIASGATNTVGCLLGADYGTGPALCVYIDADGLLKASIVGQSGPATVLVSSVRPMVDNLYSVALSRQGTGVRMWVNGVLEATGTYSAGLTDIEVWSAGGEKTLTQGMRYPFVGIIQRFDIQGDAN